MFSLNGAFVVAAVVVTVGILLALVVTEVVRHRRTTASRSAVSPHDRERVFIMPEALLDQRTFLQHALEAFDDVLTTRSDEDARTCERLLRLIRSQPGLIAAAVISDNELAATEARDGWEVVWTISTSEEIEFHYPATGPSFAPILLLNLERGVRYRYLVPDTPRARERAATLTREHPELEIRFMDDSYRNRFTSTLDHLVVYQAPSSGRLESCAFYAFPGSNPLEWIAADAVSIRYRLDDVRLVWNLAEYRITTIAEDQDAIDARAYGLAARLISPSTSGQASKTRAQDLERFRRELPRVSRVIREQLYHMAQSQRRLNWPWRTSLDRADEMRLLHDSTIDVLAALAEVDADSAMIYGDLGFALKDQRVPDVDRAVSALSRAVALSEAAGYDVTADWYAVNRALALIYAWDQLDQQRRDRERAAVLADLLRAGRSQGHPRTILNEPEVQEWLRREGVADELE